MTVMFLHAEQSVPVEGLCANSDELPLIYYLHWKRYDTDSFIHVTVNMWIYF